MTNNLSRQLNALGALALSIVLGYAFYSQIVEDILACPLCLLQRVGFIAVLFGLFCNVIFGPRMVHYSGMIISAIFGAAVALRQMSLHVIPGTPGYGAPFLGMHFYTWAFITFVIIIFGTAIMMAFSAQYEKVKYIPFSMQGNIAKIAIIMVLLVTAANMLNAFAECGPFECPGDPVSYWLFR
ncbi:disulfide bond formation protein B [Moritella marina ATCC 15381]|uniref:Disulfide bond formation protein B n=1 Tax=Moritella marina ATCC 15381 TaxID=1202962 RepID=A0A5J6WKI9_MORMI|nr:disulfide bond formation protein B [Moritella marina]QFI38507.1 disulfide bond formation protein B [Moritella marina ATCC 15381]